MADAAGASGCILSRGNLKFKRNRGVQNVNTFYSWLVNQKLNKVLDFVKIAGHFARFYSKIIT